MRQNWGLDQPDTFGRAFAKNFGYGLWNAVSFGTLARQDTLVEQSEAGKITDAQYWGRTAINAGSSAAIAVAAAATGGAAAGAVQALGASTALVGVVAGAAGGVAAQAATDLIEVGGTRTKSLEQVSATDYAIAAATGGILGGIGAAAAANPAAVRFGFRSEIPGLGALDNTFVQRGAQSVENALASVAERSYAAGQRASTLVESAPPPKPQYETPFKPLSKGARASLKESLENRTMGREEYEHFDWDRRFNNRRARGVDRFWANERSTLREGAAGTRNWTPEQRGEILGGRRPTFQGETIQGHHRYNALDHPQLADDAANIYPATRSEHFNRWHGRDFRHDTFGVPLNPSYPEQFGAVVPRSGLWGLAGVGSQQP